MPVFVRGPILCITVQPRSQLKNWVLSFAPAAGPTWPTKNKTVLPFCQVPSVYLSCMLLHASAIAWACRVRGSWFETLHYVLKMRYNEYIYRSFHQFNCSGFAFLGQRDRLLPRIGASKSLLQIWDDELSSLIGNGTAKSRSLSFDSANTVDMRFSSLKNSLFLIITLMLSLFHIRGMTVAGLMCSADRSMVSLLLRPAHLQKIVSAGGGTLDWGIWGSCHDEMISSIAVSNATPALWRS